MTHTSGQLWLVSFAEQLLMLSLRDRNVILPVRPAGRSREPEHLVPYQNPLPCGLPFEWGKASGESLRKNCAIICIQSSRFFLAIDNIRLWGVSEDGVCAAHPHLLMHYLHSLFWSLLQSLLC